MEVNKTEILFSKDPIVELLASLDGETDFLDLDFRTQFHASISWEMQLDPFKQTTLHKQQCDLPVAVYPFSPPSWEILTFPEPKTAS